MDLRNVRMKLKKRFEEKCKKTVFYKIQNGGKSKLT